MDKRKLKKKTLSVISKLYVILIFLFFYAPVVVMVVFSFNDSRANVVWQGFTTKWYTKLFQDTELWMVFGKTLFIAVVTTLLGVVVGTMGAVGFMNAKFILFIFRLLFRRSYLRSQHFWSLHREEST